MAVTFNKETGVLYVDNSILTTYATCPTKATISYGLDRRRVDEDNANLVVGSALHKVLEHYYLGDSAEVCQEVLQKEYEDWARANIFDNKRLSYDNIKLVWQSWLDKNPRDRLPFSVDPGMIEMAFGVPLNDDGSIVFTGRIDLVARAKHGSSLYAIDNKTTGNIDSRKKREYSTGSQMTGYLWALQQLGHEIAGIYINAVHTGIVPTSNRKCSTHRTLYEECGFLHMNHELLGPYQRSQQELETWRQDALSLALEWRQVLEYVKDDINRVPDIQQRGRWIYQACTMCPWEQYCKSGQPKHWLQNQTVVAPWFPGVLGDEQQ